MQDHVRKFGGSELTAPVCVDDLRCAVFAQGFADDFYGMTRVRNRGYLMRQHPPAGNIECRGQLHKNSLHRDVGGVQRPDMIGLVYAHIA